MNSINFYSIVLLQTVTVILCKQKSQCSVDSLIKADSNVAKIISLGQADRKFPETDQQTIKYCQDTFKYINSVQNFTRSCLVEISKQVSQVLFYQVKNQVKQLCKKNSKRRNELIKVAPCANRASRQFNKCNSIFIDKLLGIKNTDQNKKIAHICCEYQKIFSCVHQKGSELCNSDELDQAANLVRVMTGGVLGSLCAEYRDDNDKCDKLGKIPKKTKSQRRSKSFYIPLLEVFDSFDNKDLNLN